MTQPPSARPPHIEPTPAAAASPPETAAPATAERPETPTALAPPAHIAIIMDGNGRWATQRGLQRTEGHRAGTEAARRIVEESLDLGVHSLTLYTFSRENWNRPAEEVRFLFDLLVEFITKELPVLEKRGVRLRILGEPSGLPFAARRTLAHACNRTAHGKKMILNLALNYSGKEEIVRACRRLMETDRGPAELTPEVFAEYLYTEGLPDPDLVIRSGGEKRISNFLLFQTAYSELYFTDVLWPDFSPEELRKAIDTFHSRNRRFGGI